MTKVDISSPVIRFDDGRPVVVKQRNVPDKRSIVLFFYEKSDELCIADVDNILNCSVVPVADIEPCISDITDGGKFNIADLNALLSAVQDAFAAGARMP